MLTQDEAGVKARTTGRIHRQRRHNAARADPTTCGAACRLLDHDAKIEADDWLQARRITSGYSTFKYSQGKRL